MKVGVDLSKTPAAYAAELEAAIEAGDLDRERVIATLGGDYCAAVGVVLAQYWLPVSSAPKDGRLFLALLGPTGVERLPDICVAHWSESEFGVTADCDEPDPEYGWAAFFDVSGGHALEDDSFTHWMPLPAPPK